MSSPPFYYMRIPVLCHSQAGTGEECKDDSRCRLPGVACKTRCCRDAAAALNCAECGAMGGACTVCSPGWYLGANGTCASPQLLKGACGADHECLSGACKGGFCCASTTEAASCAACSEYGRCANCTAPRVCDPAGYRSHPGTDCKLWEGRPNVCGHPIGTSGPDRVDCDGTSRYWRQLLRGDGCLYGCWGRVGRGDGPEPADAFDHLLIDPATGGRTPTAAQCAAKCEETQLCQGFTMDRAGKCVAKLVSETRPVKRQDTMTNLGTRNARVYSGCLKGADAALVFYERQVGEHAADSGWFVVEPRASTGWSGDAPPAPEGYLAHQGSECPGTEDREGEALVEGLGGAVRDDAWAVAACARACEALGTAECLGFLYHTNTTARTVRGRCLRRGRCSGFADQRLLNGREGVAYYAMLDSHKAAVEAAAAAKAAQDKPDAVSPDGSGSTGLDLSSGATPTASLGVACAITAAVAAVGFV